MNISSDFKWYGPMAENIVSSNCMEITTLPHTDLWQRTYYHFRNDNAPMLLCATTEKYFSFSVRTAFASCHRFDQCGIVIYQDSENWLKASTEYQNEQIQHLGSVVTNYGYSDWATAEIDSSIKVIWYRLSRRGNDFRIESSLDGSKFSQMRICHLFNADAEIQFGVYACSPENSSFKASFSDFQFTDCKWAAHDGQPPDLE